MLRLLRTTSWFTAVSSCSILRGQNGISHQLGGWVWRNHTIQTINKSHVLCSASEVKAPGMLETRVWDRFYRKKLGWFHFPSLFFVPNSNASLSPTGSHHPLCSSYSAGAWERKLWYSVLTWAPLRLLPDTVSYFLSVSLGPSAGGTQHITLGLFLPIKHKPQQKWPSFSSPRLPKAPEILPQLTMVFGGRRMLQRQHSSYPGPQTNTYGQAGEAEAKVPGS